MKILFIYPDLRTNQFAHVQHGVASISAVLKAAGHMTELLWLRDEIPDEQFVQQVRESAPDLVGFSSTTLQWPFTLRYATALKAALDQLPLIIGGVHATLDSERVWSEGLFDYLCIGEGEYPMRDLLDALEQGRDSLHIENLWLRNREQVIKNTLRPWVSPLDDLPLPDREIWDNDMILAENDHEAALMASRGCPYSCTYCSNSVLKALPAGGRHVRMKSPEYVIEEVADLASNLDVRSLFFEDEVFTLKRSWVDSFCGLYKQRFDMPFTVNVRQELVDRSMLEVLKDAGCSTIKLGVETGNEKLRHEMLGRKTTNQQIIEFFKTADDVGLKTCIFNMVGIPGDTVETIEETIQLNREIKANHVQVTMFYPFPGTKLYETCKREGYLAKHDSPSVFHEFSVLNLPTISPEDLHQSFVKFRRLGLEIIAQRAASGYYDFCANLGSAVVETENPDYVQLIPVRVNGVERMSILAHPPSKISYKVKVRPGTRLHFGIAFSPTVWDKSGGPATFEVRAKAGRWRSKKIFEKQIDPKSRAEDRVWHDYEIDLRDFAGKTVELTFITRTEPGRNEYCVAVWSKPHLVERSGQPD